jgi:hypothetical protein
MVSATDAELMICCGGARDVTLMCLIALMESNKGTEQHLWRKRNECSEVSTRLLRGCWREPASDI